MFIEEHIEQFLLDTLRNAQIPEATGYDAGIERVKAFEIGEVTLDTLGNYAKITPAIVLNVGEDNRATSQINAIGDAQHMVFTLNVYAFVTNRFSHKAQMDDARPILRGIRNTLRGLRWTKDDGADEGRGATEGMARVFYLDQTKEAIIGATVLYLQRYEIHSQDFNDTRRTL